MAAKSSLALLLQSMAGTWGIATVANGLDRENVLNGLCIRAVIESATLPANLGPGGIGNFEIHAGISILGRAVRHTPPLTIRLSGFSPATVSPASGQTSAQGLFRTSVTWPPGSSSLRINMLASLPHPTLGVGRNSIAVSTG